MGEDKGWDEVLEEIGERLNEEVEARFLRHSVVAWELLMQDWGDTEIDRIIGLIQKQVGDYSGSILIMYMFARLWEKGTITAVIDLEDDEKVKLLPPADYAHNKILGCFVDIEESYINVDFAVDKRLEDA